MRILLSTEDLHRTAGTMLGTAGDLAGSGGRIALDAATIMPPAVAADAVATIARVEGRLATVGARYVEQSADLTRRAVFAEVSDSQLFKEYVSGAEATRLLELGIGYLDDVGKRRFFFRGRFSVRKWLLGGHLWGYKNGLKSQLRRDWNTLRGLARMSGSTWHKVQSEVTTGAKNELKKGKSVLGKAGRLFSSIKSGSVKISKVGVRVAGRTALRVANKLLIPWSLVDNYKNSNATSFLGRATSSVLRTGVGLVPVVAVADIVTDGGASGALDVDISAAESLVTHDGSYTRSMQAVQEGKYGPVWQSYYKFCSGG